VSIVRPELAQRLTRWREVIVWGAVLAVGLALVVRGLSPVAPLLLLAGGVAALIGAALLSAALRRVAFGSAGPAEGVVEIDEGRIGYLSPNWGGFMDVGAVVRVELVSRQGLFGGGGHAWVLTSEDGERLTGPPDGASVGCGASVAPALQAAMTMARLASPGRARRFTASS
jgi:hypothetical protein